MAVALHGLVALAVYRSPISPPAAPPPAEAALEATEVFDVTEAFPATEPAASDESAPPPQEQAAAPGAMRIATVAERGGGRVEPPSERAPDEAPRAVGEPGDAPPSGGPDEPQALVITGPRSFDELGIGRKNPLLPKSEAEVEAAEQKRLRDRTLRDPARERDQALGLGPEGPVLSALADGTSQSTAPITGRAVFLAKTGPGGEVESIELQDAEGGRAGWAEAARIALASLRGKKLNLRGGTTRAVMRLEVKSAWKLPSGHDPGVEMSVFHVPLKKGEGKQSTRVKVLEPEVGVSEIMISPGVTLKVPYFHVTILGIAGDPADIGAAPRRVIHTRALETTVM